MSYIYGSCLPCVQRKVRTKCWAFLHLSLHSRLHNKFVWHCDSSQSFVWWCGQRWAGANARRGWYQGRGCTIMTVENTISQTKQSLLASLCVSVWMASVGFVTIHILCVWVCVCVCVCMWHGPLYIKSFKHGVPSVALFSSIPFVTFTPRTEEEREESGLQQYEMIMLDTFSWNMASRLSVKEVTWLMQQQVTERLYGLVQ